MSVNWNLYEARLGINGSSQRARNINKLQSDIERYGVDSPSYKIVTIGSESKGLFIDSTKDPYVKTFCDKFGVIESAGTIVKFGDKYWLVESLDPDAELYSDGILRMCNYELKFLDSNGHPVSRHCYVENATRYNSGVKTTGSEVKMELGSSQYLVKLPFDSTTSLLVRDKRLLIRDVAHRVSQADSVSIPGCIILTLIEDATCENDNLVLGIADYYSQYVAPLPEPTSDYCLIKYSGELVLKYGLSPKTFYVKYYDAEGELLDPQPNSVWTLELSDDDYISYVQQTIASDTSNIKLKILDERLIGMTITLSVNSSDETMSDSKTISILPLG